MAIRTRPNVKIEQLPNFGRGADTFHVEIPLQSTPVDRLVGRLFPGILLDTASLTIKVHDAKSETSLARQLTISVDHRQVKGSFYLNGVQGTYYHGETDNNPSVKEAIEGIANYLTPKSAIRQTFRLYGYTENFTTFTSQGNISYKTPLVVGIIKTTQKIVAQFRYKRLMRKGAYEGAERIALQAELR